MKSAKENDIIAVRLTEPSNNAAAKRLGIPRRTVDRTVNRVIDRAEEAGVLHTVDTPKILVMDIETAPMVAHLWSFWQRGIPHQAQEKETYILSWAAKWVGQEEVYCDALCYNEDYEPGTEDDVRMLQGIWKLLDEADFVVAHNGDKFDIKRLNTRFLLAGMSPPAPYKSIDTLKMVKRCFAFDSNRLDYILSSVFGYGKTDSGGFDTWKGCLAGNMETWDKLIEYNKDDVTKLEDLYLRIRSWDRLHPSAATHGNSTATVPCCTKCGSENVSPTDKTVSTGVSRFLVWECDDCGGKMRGRTSILTPEQRKNLLVSA